MAEKNGAGQVMLVAELKPLLKLSRRRPVSCAIAMTKDKQGVVLLHRRTKPRKLMAELRRQATAAGIELNAVSIRFGRAVVDGASDSTLVRFTVNKAAPGAMRMALLEQLRPAGFQRCEIVVDEALETEAEDGEDEADDDENGGQDTAGSHGAGAGAMGGGGAPAGAGRTEAAGPAAPGKVAPSAALIRSGRDATAALGYDAAGAAQGATAPDAASVRTRLTALVRRTVAAVASNPPGVDAKRSKAAEARDALASGDLVTAGRAADALEHLLDGTPPDGTSDVGPSSDDPAKDGATAAPVTDAGLTGPPASGTTGAGTQSGASTDGDAAAAGSAASTRNEVGKPVFEKGRIAWIAVRAKLQGDLDATLQKLTAIFGESDERVKMVHERVEPIMGQLDDSLAVKLGEVARTTAPDACAALVQEAEAIIARYRKFVAEEPMVAEFDQNPFHPMTMQKTLDTALAALSKVVETAK